MKYLGIDIGTTSISFVVMDEARCIFYTQSLSNDSTISGLTYERLQHTRRIETLVISAVSPILEAYPDIGAIGVTGQMHGIVYLSQFGEPVSPLYTWQDGRGDLLCTETETWAEHLQSITGYQTATGYGLVTHYYNQQHNLVPEDAAVFCTIQDYIAMRLAERTVPVVDSTNAHSLGLFNAIKREFDYSAIKAAGISTELLPEIAVSPLLGVRKDGIYVYCAIGDNQASFLGATDGSEDVLLANVGTGSQVSIYSKTFVQGQVLEARPYVDDGWLLVGSQLCGGRSYALLENFFRDIGSMVSGKTEPAYAAMTRILEEHERPSNCPQFYTAFQGTRQVPSLRGSITGLSTDNFTPLHFLYGMMEGMANEMAQVYEEYLHAGGRSFTTMIGSGNGLRKNPTLQKILSQRFSCSMQMSDKAEEAAYGACLYAQRHRQDQ